jgi:hypothetical protein
MVEIPRIHACEWKNETCGNYSRNGGRRVHRRMIEGMNSTMIYCQNFCKRHIVSPSTTII